MASPLLVFTLIGGLLQGTFFGPVVTDLGDTNAKGKPFLANLRQSISRRNPNGNVVTRSVTGTIARDSSGRYRQDLFFKAAPGQSLSFAIIQEAVAKVTYVLDLTNRTVIQQETLVKEQGDNSIMTGLSAQKKVIEGLTCIVYKIKARDGIEMELWFSEDLETVLFERTVSGSEEREIRLDNIRRIEPDESLFRIPADFKRKK